MKTLISIFFILVSLSVFSQKKDSNVIKMPIEDYKKVTTLKELITSIPSDNEVISVEFTYSYNGKIQPQSATGKGIDEFLKTKSFKKGEFLYIDAKTKNSKNNTIKITSVKIKFT